MEGLEIHPVLSRIVCLNQPHLKPWWLTQGLCTTLQCFYNPHQPQVIWTAVPLQLPAPRILRIKGHTSHPLPSSASPSLKVNVQMGTYLTFYMPTANGLWSSCHLVINGVQSVSGRTDNPSSFSVQLVHTEHDTSPSSRVKPDLNSNPSQITNGVRVPASKGDDASDEGSGERPRGVADPVVAPKLFGDFRSAEVVTTIAEEEEAAQSDQDSDASEDIHKLVLRRLMVDLSMLVAEWRKTKDESNTMVLLVKPEVSHQAWQFISSWVLVKEKNTDEVSCSTLTRRKGVTRSKPFQPTSNSHTSPSRKLTPRVPTSQTPKKLQR